jgi:hypothetical protein
MRRMVFGTGLLLGLALAAVPTLAQGGHGGAHRPDSTTSDPRSLLRMVATLQELHRAETGAYARTPGELGIPALPLIRFQLLGNGSAGYSAVASTAAEECVFYRGEVRSPRGYATRPDRITCIARGEGGSGSP